MKALKIALVTIALLIGSNSFAQTSKHCIAKKKNGEQCKNYVQKESDYCYMHDPKTLRCGAIKKDGKPCLMLVKEAGMHCRYHS